MYNNCDTTLLFHRDVFLPTNTQEKVKFAQKSLRNFRISAHLIERMNDTFKDRSHNYKLNSNIIKEYLKQIKACPLEAFEIEFRKNYYSYSYSISKYCVRVPFKEDATQDLILVIRPEDNYSLVVTAYLNSKYDNHFTLNTNKYCSKERWGNKQLV